MACIKKLAKDIIYDCAVAAPVSQLGSVEEMILINYDDISNYSALNGVVTITMKQGTRGFVVSSVGNSVSTSIAARQNDILASAQEHSVIISLIGKTVSDPIAAGPFSDLLQTLQQGTFVAVTNTAHSGIFVYGIMSGLECSEIAGDSAAGGRVQVTLKTPDGAGGDFLVALSSAEYEGLKKVKS